LDGIKGNFYVSEFEYVAPSILHERGKSSDMMIYSGAKEIVEHQQYIFDSFWNTSSSAERKILEIQSNIDLGIAEIIDSPSRTQELFISLIKSAKSEIPTINAFLREHKIGVMHLLKELSTTHEGRRAVNIRILMPTNNTIEKIIKGMKEPTSVSKVPFSSDTTSLNIRHLESQPEYNVTTVTILVLQEREERRTRKRSPGRNCRRY